MPFIRSTIRPAELSLASGGGLANRSAGFAPKRSAGLERVSPPCEVNRRSASVFSASDWPINPPSVTTSFTPPQILLKNPGSSLAAICSSSGAISVGDDCANSSSAFGSGNVGVGDMGSIGAAMPGTIGSSIPGGIRLGGSIVVGEAGTGFLGGTRSDSFGSGLMGAGVVCRGRFAATRARGVIRAFLPLSVTRGADDAFAVLLASRTCAIRK